MRLSLALALLLSSEAFAQQSTSTSFDSIEDTVGTSTKIKKDDENIEKVEVTGSYIRRIDREGAALVTKIEREDLFRTGSIEFMDVLREDPAFEGIYDNSSQVRLRGQSNGSVLVLLNGMRLPKRKGGFFNSVKSLPTSVMETAEVLKDGGSALYGSDAMSGVINYKTRKDFDGAELQMNTRFSEDGIGTQQSYAVSYGKTFNRGNILGVVQYEQSDAVFERDLGSFVNSDTVASNGNTTASVGNFNIGDTYVDDRGRTRSSRFNDLGIRQAFPEDNDITAMLSGSYDLNSNMKASMLTVFNRKETIRQRAPGLINWANRSSTATFDAPLRRSEFSADALANLDSVDAFGGRDSLNIRGTFIDELGIRTSEEIEDSVNVQTQLEGYVGDTWTWTVMAGGSRLDIEETALTGEIDQGIARNLITSGATDLVNGNADFSSAFVTPTARAYGEMYQAKAIATGELMNFSNGGIVSAAFGAEQQYETFRFENDEVISNGRTLLGQEENNKGSRRVSSGFLEIAYAPITEVELNVSGRYDTYSDVGDTFNPRFAFQVNPVRSFMLRGSIGTGFRAPGLTDVNGAEIRGIDSFRDQVCENNGGSNCRDDYNVTRFNSDDLRPEEGLNYGLGMVIQPTKGLSFTVDQWNFEGKDTITAIDPEEYTAYESQFGSEAARDAGATIVRNADGSLQSFTAPRVTNLGERTIRGIDASLDFDSNFNNALPFRLGFSNGFSYIFERTERRFALEDLRELQNSWKLNNRISISTDVHSVSVRALTTSSFFNRNETFKFQQMTTLDLSYGYNTPWNSRINIVIKNIADRPVPADDTFTTVRRGFTAQALSAFSPIGRRIFANYTQRF